MCSGEDQSPTSPPPFFFYSDRQGGGESGPLVPPLAMPVLLIMVNTEKFLHNHIHHSCHLVSSLNNAAM